MDTKNILCCKLDNISINLNIKKKVAVEAVESYIVI